MIKVSKEHDNEFVQNVFADEIGIDLSCIAKTLVRGKGVAEVWTRSLSQLLEQLDTMTAMPNEQQRNRFYRAAGDVMEDLLKEILQYRYKYKPIDGLLPMWYPSKEREPPREYFSGCGLHSSPIILNGKNVGFNGEIDAIAIFLDDKTVFYFEQR